MKIKTAQYLKLFKTPVRLALALIVLLSSGGLFGLLITTTTPDEVGPLGVTTLFIVVFVVALTSLTLMKMFVKRSTSVTVEGLVGWALIPTLFLALGTLKQLTIVDVVLILLFVVLLSFYIKRATNNPQS